MKKYQLTLMLSFLSFAVPCLSQQVSMQEASRAAINIMRKETRGDTNIYMQSIRHHSGENGEVLLYEVFLSNGTSVLLSGNRNCVPLLAINYNSETSILDTLNDCPDGVKEFLYRYTFQIKQQYLSKSICPENQESWDILQQYDNSTVQAPRAPVYGPLTTTKWGQGNPYNNYVQSNCSSGGKCLLGCTAVAMGQIMKYWNYPIITYDFYKQFDWCNMPDAVNTSTEIDAVSWLLYQCAEAIDMHYCIDNECESLGWPSNVPDALRFWGYADSIRLDERGLTSYSTWSEMIIRELQAGRPVLYAGIAAFISIYGHSFVCDGYDAGDRLFHFNWGFSGSHNNEWFRIDSLAPNSHNYSHQERIVRYISPANNLQNYCNSQVPLGEFYNNYYNAHIGGYNNNTPSSLLVPAPYKITPQTVAVLVSASSTSRSEFRTIPINTTATYEAHREIVLIDGFTAEYGSDFTAKIVKCPNCEENRNNEEDYSVESGGEQPVDMAPAHIGNVVATGPQQADIYPNPTDGELTMAIDGDVEAVVILDINGNPQGGWDLLSFNEEHIFLNVRRLKAGAYLLTVRHPDGRVESARFIKQ